MDGEVHVILGCYGRADDGFVSCGAIQNVIFKLLPTNPYYSEIMDYFDNHQLFTKALMDYNGVRHFVFNMQSKFSYPTQKLWSEKMFTLLQKFTLDHKNCGIFLQLGLPE